LTLDIDAFGENESDDFLVISREYLDKMKWGEQEYLKNHIHKISIRVKEEIDKQTGDDFSYGFVQEDKRIE